MRQFDFSETAPKRRTRSLVITLLVCALYVSLFAHLATDIATGMILKAIGITAVWVLIIFVVEFPLINRSMRAMKVLVYDDKIVKQYRRGEQSLSWVEVVRVKLTKNPAGDCIYIKMWGKDKKTVHLGDFEQMQDIARLIRENIAEDVAVETKQNKIDYESTMFAVPAGLAATTIVSLAHLRGRTVENIFCILVATAVALFILVCKPAAKFNPRLRLFETILLLLLILATALMLMEISMPVL